MGTVSRALTNAQQLLNHKNNAKEDHWPLPQTRLQIWCNRWGKKRKQAFRDLSIKVSM